LTLLLLILHGLAAVILLGAITHQAVATVVDGRIGRGFFARYTGTRASGFTRAVIVTYIVTLMLGALLYPTYRLDVRVAFEEMSLGWAIGLFELKEHWGALGLALLPSYSCYWNNNTPTKPARTIATLTLAAVVWFNFIVGHLLNNYRGL